MLAAEFLEPEGPRSWVGPRFGDEEAAPEGKALPPVQTCCSGAASSSVTLLRGAEPRLWQRTCEMNCATRGDAQIVKVTLLLHFSLSRGQMA